MLIFNFIVRLQSQSESSMTISNCTISLGTLWLLLLSTCHNSVCKIPCAIWFAVECHCTLYVR